MSIKKTFPVLMLLLVLLLASCSGGKSKLVGRWINYSDGEQTAGTIYEFYENDVCLTYEFTSAVEMDYPLLTKQNTCGYALRFNTLILTLRLGSWSQPSEDDDTPGRFENFSYKMTFLSDDELTLIPEGQSEGLTYQRAPLPEMPLDARLLLSERLRRENVTVVSAERFEGDWHALFPDYREASSDHILAKEYPQQWAVVVQEQGASDPQVYILVEGDSWWGVIRLVKEE